MKYTKKQIEEFLRESNLIEGVSDEVSLKQALKAWNFLSKQKKLTIGVILKTHKILSLHSSLRPNEKGYFRTRRVWIGGREGIEWEKIPKAMDEWIKDVETSIKIPGKDGANITLDHITFEQIHGFIDFNGRSGRLFLLWERKQAKLPIWIIKANDRFEYYELFRDPVSD